MALAGSDRPNSSNTLQWEFLWPKLILQVTSESATGSYSDFLGKWHWSDFVTLVSTSVHHLQPLELVKANAHFSSKWCTFQKHRPSTRVTWPKIREPQQVRNFMSILNKFSPVKFWNGCSKMPMAMFWSRSEILGTFYNLVFLYHNHSHFDTKIRQSCLRFFLAFCLPQNKMNTFMDQNLLIFLL